MTATWPKWMGLKVPGDTMVFWWPAGTDPDTTTPITELYDEAPEAEIVGKLAMVSDVEADD
jgi:hypothetical protein